CRPTVTLRHGFAHRVTVVVGPDRARGVRPPRYRGANARTTSPESAGKGADRITAGNGRCPIPAPGRRDPRGRRPKPRRPRPPAPDTPRGRRPRSVPVAAPGRPAPDSGPAPDTATAHFWAPSPGHTRPGPRPAHGGT